MFSQDLPRQRMNVNNYQCNTVLNGVITIYKKFFLVFSSKNIIVKYKCTLHLHVFLNWNKTVSPPNSNKKAQSNGIKDCGKSSIKYWVNGWICQRMLCVFCKAGILTEQLTICLEPEAASLYCQHLPTTKLMGNPGTQSFLSNSSGTKYMIIDLGGR